jgi:hypothetical protein
MHRYPAGTARCRLGSAYGEPEGAGALSEAGSRLGYPWIRAATCLQVRLKPRFFASFP